MTEAQAVLQHLDEQEPVTKPPRKPAVKGKCANCGLNYSRHMTTSIEGGLVYCDSSHTRTFTLEPEQPAAVQTGGITREQADRIKELAELRQQAIDANTRREEEMLAACRRFDEYLDEITIKQ